MFAYESYDAPMDLGGEVGAVATCVAGVTSAFENGATMLKRIKQRRSSANAPALPAMLEDSICSAAEEIQRECTRGIVRFGDQFEVGDVRAVMALQQITIQLQNSLLSRLHDIEDGDADVAALAAAADRGRDSTIATLIALRQRLAGQHEMTRTGSDGSTLSMTSPVTPRSPPPMMSPIRMTVSASRMPPSVPPPIPMRSHDRGKTYYEPSSFQPRIDEARFTYREVAEDQFEIQSARSSIRGDGDSSSSLYSSYPCPPSINVGSWAPQTTPHARSESTPNVPTALRSPSTSAFSWTTKNTHGRSSSASSTPPLQTTQSYPLNFTSSNQHPTAQNNYLGFCKAAWKLQCGDEKALNKAKDFQHSVHSKYHFLTCSKFRCEFKGKGPAVLTNRVVTDLERGLKYRWTFLAKSHVFIKSAPNEQFSYLCMFCVFAGGRQVVMNSAALLDHISQTHRGGVLSDVILDRTFSVQGRMCKDTEKFDMNLFTVEEQAQTPRDSGVYRPFSTDSRESAEQGAKRSEAVELSARRESGKVFELHASS